MQEVKLWTHTLCVLRYITRDYGVGGALVQLQEQYRKQVAIELRLLKVHNVRRTTCKQDLQFTLQI